MMVKSRKKSSWKPVEIDLKESAPDLIGFEELVDYTVVKGKYNAIQYDEDDAEEPSKKVGKKNIVDATRRKRKPSPNIEESEPRKKKKKKKKPTVVENISETTTSDQVSSLDAEVDMSAWDSFSLPEEIIKALAVKKFTKPTEIQKLSLPEAIVNKKDVLGAAETGSGKTLAFAIPIVTALLEAEKSRSTLGTLGALILTPTRELAIQVKNHIRDLCAFTNIKVQEIVGGLSAEKQNRKLSEKPHIVVGTPGRLWELINSGNEHLSQINNTRFFVIDEADRMFEKNHFIELENLLERIHYSGGAKKSKTEKRQIFVFSATLTLIHEPPSYVYKKKKGKSKKSVKPTPEKKLSTFINSLHLKNPAVIDISKKHVLASGISESCIQCAVDEKDYYLYYLMKVHSGKKIVFCNSVSCVKRLHRLLNVLQCNAKILFADMDQKQRLKNLDNFEKHPNALLVATDVAARGLDIANIDYIIHYQVPKTTETYVHRSGRSVRGASALGTSILLCSVTESYYCDKIRKTLEKDTKLPSYNVSSPEAFAAAKRIVNVSRKIEQLETKMRNVQTNASCIEKWAKEMDILIDDDEMPEKLDDSTRKSCQLQIKKLRAELRGVLSQPILPRMESCRYPRFEAVQSYIQQCASNKK